MEHQKTSIIFPIILLVIIVSAIIYFQRQNITSKSDAKTSEKITTTTTAKESNITDFGVFTNYYAANPGERFDQNVFDRQIKLWKSLGINHLRTNFERNGWTPVDKPNSAMISSAQKNKLKLTFIVESPFDDFAKEASFEAGYKWGKIVGAKYTGKVDYYQLANEVSGTAILPNRNGLKDEDYDSEKYNVLKDYLLGLAKGLKETDPQAKQIVSAHWLGLTIIDKLIADGVKPDVIGWNWYSEMGDNVSSKKLDEGEVIDIPGHFAKYGLPFWVVELNKSAGDSESEIDQASFLEKFFANAKESNKVNGVFIYKLLNSICTEGDKPTSHLGIVKDKKSDTTKSGCDIGETKKAYNIFKNFISVNK